MKQAATHIAPRESYSKNRGRRKMAVMAICLAGMCAMDASAERTATFWVSQSGDFFDPGNWSLGAPSSVLDAKIDNGGIARINTETFSTVPYVYLGSAQNSIGTLEVAAGGIANFTTMVVGALNARGTLNIHGGGRLTSFGGPVGSDYLGVGIANVSGSGSSWRVTGSEMVVGGNGSGNVIVEDGGNLSVGNGTGRILLANHPLADGKLTIGAGGLPGSINASEIYNGEGTATVTFNHSSPSFTFTPKFTGLKTVNGYLNVRHEGTGTTVFAAAESRMAGNMTIASGTAIVNGSIVGSTTQVVVDDMLVDETTVGTVDVLGEGTLGGSGFIAGAATIEGRLAPGESAGVLTFGGDLTLTATGRVRIELGGSVRGTQHDGIDLAGKLLYAGTLEIVFLGGFLPGDGESFDLFDGFSTWEGNFDNIAFTSDGFGGAFDPETGLLTVAIVPEPTVLTIAVAGLVVLAIGRSRRPHRS